MIKPQQPYEEETEICRIAGIRLVDGGNLPCSVKHVFSSGMKRVVGKGFDVPTTSMLKIVGRDLLLQVKKLDGAVTTPVRSPRRFPVSLRHRTLITDTRYSILE